MDANEIILADIAARGGVYVWEPEIFTVAFMADVAVTDADVLPLIGLQGVKQIALNAASLSHAAVARVAGTPGLRSLVLFNSHYSEGEMATLRAICSDVVLA